MAGPARTVWECVERWLSTRDTPAPTSTQGHTVVGCGCATADVRDTEDFVDCTHCGMWFAPEAPATSGLAA